MNRSLALVPTQSLFIIHPARLEDSGYGELLQLLPKTSSLRTSNTTPAAHGTSATLQIRFTIRLSIKNRPPDWSREPRPSDVIAPWQCTKATWEIDFLVISQDKPKLDRLTRNVRFMLTLLDSGVEVLFCNLPVVTGAMGLIVSGG